MVCTTCRLRGSITLSVALPVLATQTRPSGARATLRGTLPVATSASLTWPVASNTLTLSLSGLTIHNRPPPRGSHCKVDEWVGRPAVGAWCTAWVKLREPIAWPPASTVSCTPYRPGAV